jgi:glycosyltransferase involved in cell wall biosynthesis
MSQEPLISVLVPAYNAEAFLEQCLESIVAQTYRHLEIIVVDDGSTDGTATISDRWAERDDRIRVIHQPNGGHSAARNTALDAMTGELVIMVDSDDVLHPQFTATLLELMQKHDADIAVGGYTAFYGVEPDFSGHRGGSPRSYDQQQALLAVFYQQGLTHSPWGRLFKASLFDGIRFPLGMYKSVRDERRQGDLVAIGAFYGYSWPLGRHWNLEALIGAAVGYAKYDRFACGQCGSKMGDESKVFLMPQAALNIVYNIPLKKQEQRKK